MTDLRPIPNVLPVGPRLMMLAAIITGGLAVVPVPAAAENGVVLAGRLRCRHEQLSLVLT